MNETLEPAAVTQQMNRKAPSYMVPERIIVKDAMPKTGNGKVDRKSLISEAESTTAELVTI